MKNLSHLEIGAYIFCASDFSLKTLLRYPLRYVIQAFTGGREEHVAQIIGQNLIADSTGDGVKIRTIESWLEEHVRGQDMKLYAYEFLRELSTDEKAALFEFWYNSVGQKYNALLAAYSALDKLLFLKKLRVKKVKGTFCSMKCAESLQIIGVKLESKKINPKELANLLTKKNLTLGKVECGYQSSFLK